MSTQDAYFDELLELLISAKDKDALKTLLESLLTASELSEIPKRLQIAKMLRAGIPQREIAKTLRVGIATVSRGSKELKAGNLKLGEENE